MAVRRINVYVDGDVAEILAEVKPKSKSGYFNCAVREHHHMQEQLNQLCEDVAEIKAMLKSLSPNQADQTRR